MGLLTTMLRKVVDEGASDLYLSTGRAPAMRIQGRLVTQKGAPLTRQDTETLALQLMTSAQYKQFKDDPEMNLSYNVEGIGRFRFNIFRQKREIAMVIRAIPHKVPKLDELGVPPILRDVVMLKRGLVLVVGSTGTGKSTTLASLMDHRNHHHASHIITLEDPIEYLLEHDKSVVNQREIGTDTRSYAQALKNALRQSPDVLMIGEIRDQVAMEHALMFSDTGHLCLATLHANNSSQAFERMINLFPAAKREQLMLSLSLNIRAVVSQQLVPTIDGKRSAVFEILLSTPRVTDLIRRGAFDELAVTIEKGASVGMQTLDQSLYELHQSGVIAAETALEYASSYRDMRLRMRFDTAAHTAATTTGNNMEMTVQ